MLYKATEAAGQSSKSQHVTLDSFCVSFGSEPPKYPASLKTTYDLPANEKFTKKSVSSYIYMCVCVCAHTHLHTQVCKHFKLLGHDMTQQDKRSSF